MKIDEGKSYFFNEKKKPISKYVMWSAFVDHDGDRYGFFRNLKSSQDEINQRRSKGLHELVSRRIKAEDGAFSDIEVTRREAVRPDGVVIYNKGYEMEFDDAVRLQNVEGQLKFLEDAKAEIENFGPNPALIGQGLEYKSGRAISLLQQAGLAELGPFVVNHRAWKLRIYRALWSAIQRYWTGERWIRVTDNQDLAQMIQVNGLQRDEMGYPVAINRLADIDVNIILDEGPDEVNMMADAYDTLVALAHQGSNIPPEVLLELAPLQNSVKKRLIGMMNQPNPMQQQAAMLQLQQLAAQIKETLSKVELNLAKAGTEGADANPQLELFQTASEERRADQQHQQRMVTEQTKRDTMILKNVLEERRAARDDARDMQKHQQQMAMQADQHDQRMVQGEEAHRVKLEQARSASQQKSGQSS